MNIVMMKIYSLKHMNTYKNAAKFHNNVYRNVDNLLLIQKCMTILLKFVKIVFSVAWGVVNNLNLIK